MRPAWGGVSLCEAAASCFVNAAVAVCARKVDDTRYLSGAQCNPHLRAGDYDDAIQQYTLAVGLSPSDARGLTNRAAALMRVRRWRDAACDCDWALQVAPGNIKALLRKAEALRQLGQVADALLVSGCVRCVLGVGTWGWRLVTSRRSCARRRR